MSKRSRKLKKKAKLAMYSTKNNVNLHNRNKEYFMGTPIRKGMKDQLWSWLTLENVVFH